MSKHSLNAGKISVPPGDLAWKKPILQHGIIPNKVIPRAAALLEVTHH